ncbi:hypothetical protein VR010_00665 [Actinomycetaceae bacterium L2_0104]
MSTAEFDPVEHDADLAWELYEAQPTHPEIPRLAQRVLAARPERSGMRILLAQHHEALGDLAEARRILHDLVGRNDRQLLNALRDLRDLEIAARDFGEALRWADAVLRKDPENWHDHFQFGYAMAFAGDLEGGWQQMEEAVAMCARTDVDSLPEALALHAVLLLMSFAPPAEFIEAAEKAIRADPSNEHLATPLAYANLAEYRFDEAEQLLLRMLRIDPTDELAAGTLATVREVKAVLEKGAATVDISKEALVDVLRKEGFMEMMWLRFRAQETGTDLGSALAALEPLLPDELRRTLHPPLDQGMDVISGTSEILAWHDGQDPGTGGLWGTIEAFRLMTNAEVAKMDAAIERDPELYPNWDADGSYYKQVLTDDNGTYLIEGPRGCLYRRGPAGTSDVEVAPSLADWFWDRVAAFGGSDPRPTRSTT